MDDIVRFAFNCTFGFFQGDDFAALVTEMRAWIDTNGEATESDFKNKIKEMNTRKGQIVYGTRRKRSKRLEEKAEAAVSDDWKLILAMEEKPSEILSPIVQFVEVPSENCSPIVEVKDEPSEDL